MKDVLLIPGLGGRSYEFERRYVRLLNKTVRLLSRTTISSFDSRWSTNETAEQKLSRLDDFYISAGKPKVVAGSSAGASLAVCLAARRPEIEEVHLICGKIRGSEKIGDDYQRRAPAFLDMVKRCEEIVEEGQNPERFVCYAPPTENDGVIERTDMIYPGAHVVRLPRLNHLGAIAYTLIRHLPTM